MYIICLVVHFETENIFSKLTQAEHLSPRLHYEKKRIEKYVDILFEMKIWKSKKDETIN